MIRSENTNTGFDFNTMSTFVKFHNWFELIPSVNSAFSVCRKRVREVDTVMGRPNKYKKMSEDFNKCSDENTIWSISSVTSSPPKVFKIAETQEWSLFHQSTPNRKREDKLRTKTQEFLPYHQLDMKTRPIFYNESLQDIGIQWIRGRKRSNIVKKATSFQQLISDIVIPEWESYLIEKRDKENTKKLSGIRSDAVWKKIMRDCREFYRILFKNRFHRMDYQDDHQKLNCIKVIIQELGFPQFSEANLIYSFNFFHQIHLSEKNKAKYEHILSDSSTGFDALNRYTNHSRTMFLEDPLCSRLLYFIYRNYLDFYFQLVSKNIRPKVEECVSYLLNNYEKLLNDDDVIPTNTLPI